MLMSLPDLVANYEMSITGVLHCGAHLAEEAPIYAALGAGSVWWVEGNPTVIPKLEPIIAAYPGQSLIEALLYDQDGETVGFNITNYDGMSSSVLEFGTHPQFSPDTVFVDRVELSTRSIDSLVAEHQVEANFLNMDLQGAEGRAVRGGRTFIDNQVDYIMTEVNKDEVYVDCAKVWELDEMLGDFERVKTHWVGNQGWGDGLYIRRVKRSADAAE